MPSNHTTAVGAWVNSKNTGERPTAILSVLVKYQMLFWVKLNNHAHGIRVIYTILFCLWFILGFPSLYVWYFALNFCFNSMFARIETDYEIRNQWFFTILEAMATD